MIALVQRGCRRIKYLTDVHILESQASVRLFWLSFIIVLQVKLLCTLLCTFGLEILKNRDIYK